MINTRILAFLRISFGVMLSYQNCSQTQFTPTDGLVHKINIDDQGNLISDDTLVDDTVSEGSDDSASNEEVVEEGDHSCMQRNGDQLCCNEEKPRKADYYISLCKELASSDKLKDIQLEDLKHLRGDNLLAVKSLKSITDKKGNLVIIGQGQKLSNIQNIQKVRGNTIFCNVSIEKLEDARGNTVLVNSSLAHLANLRGNLVLINSIVLYKENVKAKILSK